MTIDTDLRDQLAAVLEPLVKATSMAPWETADAPNMEITASTTARVWADRCLTDLNAAVALVMLYVPANEGIRIERDRDTDGRIAGREFVYTDTRCCPVSQTDVMLATVLCGCDRHGSILLGKGDCA